MISESSSVLELVDVLYKSINKAHDQVKVLGTKSFYTFKDAELIFHAKRVLSGEIEESSTIQECNTKEKAVNILEQSLNLAHTRGAFSLEACVILNSIVSLLKVKLNEEVNLNEVSTQTEVNELSVENEKNTHSNVLVQLEEPKVEKEVVNAVVSTISESSSDSDTDDDYTITLNKK